ncbi:MAG: HD domain-containing protein, partial [Chloroflexota bacterium]|nr:HD domain-containing protein [Chloroflexota bacterium]
MVISSMQTLTNLFVGAEAAAILFRLRTFCYSQNIRCFLVGGYIRDGIIGRASHDIDLTISGDAIEIARQVADYFEARFVLLDEEHQVVRVVLAQNEEQWHLDFAAMRGSIENDLCKRDFTIDALAMNLDQIEAGWNQVELIDPLGGFPDLEQGILRAASDSAFTDDPARLLRAFRLAAELGFSIDTETEELIRRDCTLITGVSGERIHDELGRILESDQAATYLRHLDRLGLLDLIFPELTASKGVDQPKEHYWDVFNHSMETVVSIERLQMSLKEKGGLLDSLAFCADLDKRFDEEIVAGRTRRGLMKLAALLHDVAKPQTKAFDKNGRMRFLGHAQQGANIVETIMERLRFSTREKRYVTRMIDQHLRPGHLSNAPELPTRRAIYRYFRDTEDVGIDTLFLSLADHLATRGPALEMDGWQEHVEVTQYMLTKWFEEETTVSPPKLINGHDLLSEFGLTPGPVIGELLEA